MPLLLLKFGSWCFSGAWSLVLEAWLLAFRPMLPASRQTPAVNCPSKKRECWESAVITPALPPTQRTKFLRQLCRSGYAAEARAARAFAARKRTQRALTAADTRARPSGLRSCRVVRLGLPPRVALYFAQRNRCAAAIRARPAWVSTRFFSAAEPLPVLFPMPSGRGTDASS